MFPLARFRVADDSMRPALAPGDYVLVNRWAYRTRAPAVGDVVVLRDPEHPSLFLLKRVASLVDPERLFVMGDNTESSRDSRAFGPVSRGLIVGKVWMRARG